MRSNPIKLLDEQLVKDVIAAYEAAFTYDEIKELLGITLGTLRNILTTRHKGTKRRKAVVFDKTKFTEMWNTGIKLSDIAKTFGIKCSTAGYIRIRLGLRPREYHTGKFTDRLKKEVLELYNYGFTVSDISGYTGIATSSIVSIVSSMAASGYSRRRGYDRMWTPKELGELLELQLLGFKDKEIAEYLDTSVPAIRMARRRHKIITKGSVYYRRD